MPDLRAAGQTGPRTVCPFRLCRPFVSSLPTCVRFQPLFASFIVEMVCPVGVLARGSGVRPPEACSCAADFLAAVATLVKPGERGTRSHVPPTRCLRPSHSVHRLLVWTHLRTVQFPWMDNFPLLPRLGLLAAYTALSIAVIIATAQRVLIRVMLNYKGFLYNARKPTVGMKLWFMIMRLLVGKRRHSLYNFQSVLPSLPVPALKDTCDRYLASVKNLQTPEQFENTEVLLCPVACDWVCGCVCGRLWSCVTVCVAVCVWPCVVVCGCVCGCVCVAVCGRMCAVVVVRS